MFKIFLLSIFFLTSFLSLAKEDSNTVIINNKAASSNQNMITAPALIPSKAKTLRNFREKQEIKTEDTILRELEKQRILDEQKRFDTLFNKSEKTTARVQANPVDLKPTNSKPILFDQKSFISLGAGLVNYYNVKNINSTEIPAFLFSFGAYGYEGRLIFDLSTFYSVHYLKTPNKNYQDIRERVDEPGLSLSMKWSLLQGKTKPYAGLSGAFVGRKWSFVTKDGTSVIESGIKTAIKDIAQKKWNFSINGGLVVGADIALGESLGLNIDFRYYLNIYTENRKTLSQILTKEKILDERDSILVSAKLKYYFQ